MASQQKLSLQRMLEEVQNEFAATRQKVNDKKIANMQRMQEFNSLSEELVTMQKKQFDEETLANNTKELEKRHERAERSIHKLRKTISVLQEQIANLNMSRQYLNQEKLILRGLQAQLEANKRQFKSELALIMQHIFHESPLVKERALLINNLNL